MPFDGNYSDTAAARAERRSRPEREARATPVSPAASHAPAAKSPDRPKKATAGDDREASRRRRRISALAEKIAAREKDIERIETRLWEEGLELGPVESHRLSEEKAQRREELERLVEEWAKLSEEETPAGSTTSR